MRHPLSLLFLCAGLLLTGCATTIRSEVTAFHEWPLDLPDKSFAFDAASAHDNDLEYRRYQSLVREQLLRLGFTSAESSAATGTTAPPKPALTVALDYGIEGRDVRVIESVLVDPGWYGPPPFYDPYFRRPWRYGYGPFYDPFWFSPPLVVPRETSYALFTRHLKLTIARAASGKKLYQVTVRSEGRIDSLAAVMPLMIRAAFAEFPGPNGVPRQIDLPLP